MRAIPVILFPLVVILCGCQTSGETTSPEKGVTETLFRLLPSSKTNVSFVNKLAENDSINIFTYQYTYNGAGVAAADFNNDGLVDLYFAANFTSGKLYFNQGDLKFHDATEASGMITDGWCTGVSVIDINNDGYNDLYICRSGPTGNTSLRRNLLYVNNGDGTFTERAAEFGIDDPGHTTQAYFFDYDMDGDLDLFVLNHSVTWEFDVQKRNIQNKLYDDHTTPRLYRNDNGHFTDVSKEAGVMSNAFSLAASVVDINNDGLPDIYVCNDYVMNDFLYVNQGDGTFRDEIFTYFPHTSYFSMGVDVCDFNNDGLFDIYTLDMLPWQNRRQKLNNGFMEYDRYMVGVQYGYGYQLMQNSLQLNNGNGTFSDISDMAGVARTDWSWAPLFGDLDNDGHKDLVVTNGYRRDFTNLDFVSYTMSGQGVNLKDRKRMRELIEAIPSQPIRNHVYRNNRDLTFQDMKQGWGMNDLGSSQGLVMADLDNDGDLDVVMNNLDGEAFIYENLQEKQNGTHHLKIELRSDLHHGGIGSIVKVVANGQSQIMDHQPTRGYLSSAMVPLHFGLGASDRVDSVIVYWCDGYYQALAGVPADTTIVIHQERSLKRPYSPLPKTAPLMKERHDLFQPPFHHVDNNDFIDFKREPLLTRMYSKDGPHMAVADVNGDGLDDLFVGGAKDQRATIYIQTSDGRFKKKEQSGFADTENREDMGCVFFDADGDGDMDLYVVSGSNEIVAPSNYYNDRLFLNDGKGNFAQAPQGSIPVTEHSGSCVIAADINGDGHVDLFLGRRMHAGRYPVPVSSTILLNDGNGRFTDATTRICPELADLGMVTCAAFTDLDGDGRPDLVVAGEYMPIRIFSNKGDRLVEATAQLLTDQRTAGIWSAILPMDVDGDGDMDLIIGNQGLNTRFNASPEKPSALYYKDFDGNGSIDPILTCYFSDGVRYPYFGRDNYIDQMRYLRKRFNTYEEFAEQTYETMFTESERDGAVELLCQRNESIWLRNDDGRFTLVPLPNPAQIFPVRAAVAHDADNNGRMDILLTGNSFHTEVNSGRMDAGCGSVLRFDPATNSFEALPPYLSGFDTPHDARSMVVLRTPNGPVIVVGNNSGRLQAFTNGASGKQQLATR